MTDDSDDGGSRTRRRGTLVDWFDWGATAFDRADARTEPIILPQLAAHVGEGFVPIRVDADRHPRVRERYNMGGFPSTVFTTPDGEVMTGATYLGPDGFRGILDSVRKTWAAKGTEAGRIPRALQDHRPPRSSAGGARARSSRWPARWSSR